MINPPFWSVDHSAGAVLIFGFCVFFAGATMFWIRWLRSGVKGGPAPTRAYFVWERSFIMAAVVLTAIGLVLLEGALQNSDGHVLARVGATAYFFGGVLWVISETSSLAPASQNNEPLVATSYVLAFLAEATVGGSLLQASLTAAWIGWATIIWNIGWLVAGLIKRRNIWIPMLPHLMPFIIGLALLSQSA